MRDEKLLRILHTDPERGMKLLIGEYAGLVYAVVRGRLSSSAFCPADIEGCAADTFSEFYCQLDKYEPEQGSIRAWLCLIAKRNALDALRRHYKDAQALSLDEESAAQYADDFSLEGNLEEKGLRLALVNAVKSLGDPDREIIVRKYFLAQSSKEIARILHMSVSNVDTRTHRAIQKLRRQFGGDDP